MARSTDTLNGLRRRFGENLVRLRNRVDLSQEETAERAGLHRTEIALQGRGARIPHADSVVSSKVSRLVIRAVAWKVYANRGIDRSSSSRLAFAACFRRRNLLLVPRLRQSYVVARPGDDILVSAFALGVEKGRHVRDERRFDVDAMSGAHEEFWEGISDKALHPVRVPIIEALWWISEPLSPIGLVDVLDGFLSIWEALHHLQALEALDVVELGSAPTGKVTGRNVFDALYCLPGQESGDG